MTATNSTDAQITVTQSDMAVLLEDPVIQLKTRVITLTRIIREQAEEIEKLKVDSGYYSPEDSKGLDAE